MRVPVVFRILAFMAIAVLTAVPPVRAQDLPPPADEWQSVITGQIEALRRRDAYTALSLAGASFHEQFEDDSRQFYFMILGAGYRPIITSRSHSFGDFRIFEGNDVFQQVFLVDQDQSLYQAIYELKKEKDGWRVQGVQLAKQQGFAV